MKRIPLRVNGVDQWIVAELDASRADLRREPMSPTGCEDGLCGSSPVVADDKPIRACTRSMAEVPADAEISTIEGIGAPDDLHPPQIAWMASGGARCGVYTPGFIMSAEVLLDPTDNPTRRTPVASRAWSRAPTPSRPSPRPPRWSTSPPPARVGRICFSSPTAGIAHGDEDGVPVIRRAFTHRMQVEKKS